MRYCHCIEHVTLYLKSTHKKCFTVWFGILNNTQHNSEKIKLFKTFVLGKNKSYIIVLTDTVCVAISVDRKLYATVSFSLE